MPSAQIIRLDPKGDFGQEVVQAAKVLLSGRVVAFPTESFYGLGASPKDEGALRRLFFVKKRSHGHPILLLVAAFESLQLYAARIPFAVRELAQAFWPGGLTLVLEAAETVSPLITGGTGKVGIRLSGHPVARALAKAAGGAITGTSANLSGEPPCRTAREVLRSLGGSIDCILDGGATTGATGSTVVDVTTEPPRILREGMISREELLPFIQRGP